MNATTTCVKALREGGHVRRVHTRPILGHYDVAQHTFGVLSLIMELHPEPSVDLVRATLWHDVPERWSGDCPAPAKWSSPRLVEGLSEVDDKVCARLWGTLAQAPWHGLTRDESRWLKACDLTEFWLWAHEQRVMGNGYAPDMIKNVQDFWDSGALATYPIPVRDFITDWSHKALPDDPREM